MDEIFPFLAGVTLGLMFGGRDRTIGNVTLLAGLACCVAMVASWISGEAALDWRYVGVDLAEASTAALIAMVLRPKLCRVVAAAR